MSGRGDANAAVKCDSNAGFEYKAISSPDTLLPITEPFGLGEDKEGALCDVSGGISKRTGSMVSAAVDEYYKRTHRRVVAVSASKGGTNTVEWLEKGLLADAIERFDRAKQFLTDKHIHIGRTLVVWCQGESDGDAKRTAQAYTENVKRIFDEFKAHGAEKCFMIQTGHYNYVKYPGIGKGHTGAEWDAYYEIIRNAQAALCQSDEDFVMAASLEPYLWDMKDNFHYNQTTYNEVGRTVGEAIARYLYKSLL